MAIFNKKVTLGNTVDKSITVDKLKLQHLLASQYIYSQNLVRSYSDKEGTAQLRTPGEYLKIANNRDTSVKVSGIENLSASISEMVHRTALKVLHKGPVAAHCIISKKGVATHVPGDDHNGMYIQVVNGVKVISIDGMEHWLREGNTILIAPGVDFVECNREECIVLKIEFKKYLIENLN